MRNLRRIDFEASGKGRKSVTALDKSAVRFGKALEKTYFCLGEISRGEKRAFRSSQPLLSLYRK